MLIPISGQASGEKVEVQSVRKSFNYMSRLFTKTRAMPKKCRTFASWLYTQLALNQDHEECESRWSARHSERWRTEGDSGEESPRWSFWIVWPL